MLYLKIFASLGVGGVAMWLFLMVVKRIGTVEGQGIQTSRLTTKQTFVVAIIVLLAVTTIVLVGLIRYAPATFSPNPASVPAPTSEYLWKEAAKSLVSIPPTSPPSPSAVPLTILHVPTEPSSASELEEIMKERQEVDERAQLRKRRADLLAQQNRDLAKMNETRSIQQHLVEKTNRDVFLRFGTSLFISKLTEIARPYKDEPLIEDMNELPLNGEMFALMNVRLKRNTNWNFQIIRMRYGYIGGLVIVFPNGAVLRDWQPGGYNINQTPMAPNSIAARFAYSTTEGPSSHIHGNMPTDAASTNFPIDTTGTMYDRRMRELIGEVNKRYPIKGLTN